jgi:hypothetical protein
MNYSQNNKNILDVFCQYQMVMCTHIWRFSEEYAKIGRYVYKITKQSS